MYVFIAGSGSLVKNKQLLLETFFQKIKFLTSKCTLKFVNRTYRLPTSGWNRKLKIAPIEKAYPVSLILYHFPGEKTTFSRLTEVGSGEGNRLPVYEFQGPFRGRKLHFQKKYFKQKLFIFHQITRICNKNMHVPFEKVYFRF